MHHGYVRRPRHRSSGRTASASDETELTDSSFLRRSQVSSSSSPPSRPCRSTRASSSSRATRSGLSRASSCPTSAHSRFVGGIHWPLNTIFPRDSQLTFRRSGPVAVRERWLSSFSLGTTFALRWSSCTCSSQTGCCTLLRDAGVDFFLPHSFYRLSRSPSMARVVYAIERKPSLLFLIRLAPYPYSQPPCPSAALVADIDATQLGLAPQT